MNLFLIHANNSGAEQINTKKSYLNIDGTKKYICEYDMGISFVPKTNYICSHFVENDF